MKIGIDNHPQDSRVTLCTDKFQTLSSRMGTGGGNVPMVLEKDMSDIVRRLTPLECERLQGFPDNWTLIGEPREKEVTDYKLVYDDDFNVVEKIPVGSHIETEYVYEVDGKEKVVSDSARYKALGNSLALPQWWWIVNKMKPYLEDNATLGSLFDGIGGFPLVWEETYGKGTPRWASEIEEFPIAVTKYRFGETGKE